VPKAFFEYADHGSYTHIDDAANRTISMRSSCGSGSVSTSTGAI